MLFRLPENSEIMASAIAQIGRRDWHWIDGQLNAPEDLIEQNLVERETGYELSRFYPTRELIVARNQRPIGETQIQPNLLAMVIDGLLPRFIRFDETGFDNSQITTGMGIQAAVSYTLRGYTGHLYFRYGWHGNSPIGNELRCDVHMATWPPMPWEHPHWLAPPMVDLQWLPEYGGEQSDYDQIVGYFKRLGLVETPLVIPAKTAT